MNTRFDVTADDVLPVNDGLVSLRAPRGALRLSLDQAETGTLRRSAVLVAGTLLGVPVVLAFAALTVGLVVSRAAWTSVWPVPVARRVMLARY